MRDEQQSFEPRPGLAERQRICGRIEGEHCFRPRAIGETHHLLAVGPGHRPQCTVIVEGQTADAQIFIPAPLCEAAIVGIEDRHAAVGRHVDFAGRGMHRQRDGDAIAEPVQNGPGLRIEPQQRPAARGRPQAALGIERHVENGRVQLRKRRRRRAALPAELPDRAAIGAAGNKEVAVRRLHDRHRADFGRAARDAGGESAGDKGAEDGIKFARRAQRSRSRNQRFGLRE